jgi:type III secretory pathway component EscV
MEISKIRQKIKQLSKEREQLEENLLQVRKKMIRGTIVYQYRKCQKGGCKCTKGKPHGPFPYLCVVVNGKSINKYIGKKEDRKLMDSLEKYKKFQKQLTRLNAIQKESTVLWQRYRQELVQEFSIGGK